MIKYRCKKCEWFDQVHKSLRGLDPEKGYCRKHKPLIFLAKDGHYYGAWPLLDIDDLCGEFREDNLDGLPN